ncbi:MAG: hypothetical protein VKO21_11350 [Candidatus Sericytochromatia bacterium]|nr:hypothetical protein [Candidatus Sericytochromatia bacterium]
MIRLPRQEDDTKGLRLLAFLMAVAMWGFVGISQERFQGHRDQRRLTLPVQLNAPSGGPASATRVEPAWVDVRLEGPDHLLQELEERAPTVSVTVPARFRAGDRVPVQVEIAEGLTYEVLPDRVTCWPEPESSKP